MADKRVADFRPPPPKGQNILSGSSIYWVYTLQSCVPVNQLPSARPQRFTDCIFGIVLCWFSIWIGTFEFDSHGLFFFVRFEGSYCCIPPQSGFACPSPMQWPSLPWFGPQERFSSARSRGTPWRCRNCTCNPSPGWGCPHLHPWHAIAFSSLCSWPLPPLLGQVGVWDPGTENFFFPATLCRKTTVFLKKNVTCTLKGICCMFFLKKHFWNIYLA